MKRRVLFFALMAWSGLAQAASSGSQRWPLPTQSRELASPAKQNPPTGMDLLWGFKIPMRDGVRLNGTVFKPAGQKEPLPVIFTLTPYIADGSENQASYFSQNGSVFVAVAEAIHLSNEFADSDFGKVIPFAELQSGSPRLLGELGEN